MSRIVRIIDLVKLLLNCLLCLYEFVFEAFPVRTRVDFDILGELLVRLILLVVVIRIYTALARCTHALHRSKTLVRIIVSGYLLECSNRFAQLRVHYYWFGCCHFSFQVVTGVTWAIGLKRTEARCLVNDLWVEVVHVPAIRHDAFRHARFLALRLLARAVSFCLWDWDRRIGYTRIVLELSHVEAWVLLFLIHFFLFLM